MRGDAIASRRAASRRCVQVLDQMTQPLTATHLGRRLLLRRQRCSAALANLAARGLVRTLSPGAPKSRLYWLTDKGWREQRRVWRSRGVKPRELLLPPVRWDIYGWLCFRHIAAVGERLLRQTKGGVLLSLPPERLSRGAFHLGTVVYEKEKWPFGLSTRELLQGLAIFGRSGAGKTTVVFHLLEQLAERRVPFLFFDWKRTGRHLAPLLQGGAQVYTAGRSLAPFPFNPFIPPPGLEPPVHAQHVADALGDAFALGDAARLVVQQALAALYERGTLAPSVMEIRATIEAAPAKGRALAWRVSALRALDSVGLTSGRVTDTESQRTLAASLLKDRTVLELDSLGQGARRFLVPILCLWLFHVLLAGPSRERLSFVLIFEEAHHLLYRHERRARETLLNTLLRLYREVGVGSVIIDQHPHLVSSAARGNAFCCVCMNLRDPADINAAAGLTQLREDEKKLLSALPVGTGVVKLQDRWRSPFVVSFPAVDVAKGSVTDERLAELVSEDPARSAANAGLVGEAGQVRRVRAREPALSDAELTLIEDVLERPDDGVRARYRRLGMSGDRGHRTKERLVRRGWLEAEVVPVGRTRKAVLRCTERTLQAVGEVNNSKRRESIAHAYWKRRWAELLKDRGYRVALEAPRRDGFVDVEAVKDGVRIAVEIETGRSDVVGNVRGDLRAGFDRIIVAATGTSAADVCAKQLAREGLLIKGRVELVSRDSGIPEVLGGARQMTGGVRSEK